MSLGGDERRTQRCEDGSKPIGHKKRILYGKYGGKKEGREKRPC